MTQNEQARFKKRKLNLEVTGLVAIADDLEAWERELTEPALHKLLDAPEHESSVAEANDAGAN